MKKVYVSDIGLSLYRGFEDEEVISWTITGYPKKSSTGLDFDSAYDFEEYAKKKVKCEGIDFDSESCQFFAYAKTEARGKKFIEDLEKWFKKIL